MGVVLSLPAAGRYWVAAWSGLQWIRSLCLPPGMGWMEVCGFARAPSLTPVRETAGGLGDMMIDGVVPLCGWPRQSVGAVHQRPGKPPWRAG